jgi:RNA polymerase sigma-70 factor, ECF subfamily
MAMRPDPDPDLALVYARHHQTVRSALRLLGVEPGNLDDAVQDVFAVFHRRLADFDRRRSLGNWLWGIARGVASGYRRSARRRSRLHVALERVAPPPAEPARRLEARVAIEAMLGELDAESCAILILTELEGRTGPEIAKQLGMNVNTVYGRLRAARLCMRAAAREHAEPRRWSAVIVAWFSDLWSVVPTCTAAGLTLVLTIGVPFEPDADAPQIIAGLGHDSTTVTRMVVPVLPLPHFRETSTPDEDVQIEIFDEPTPAPQRVRTNRKRVTPSPAPASTRDTVEPQHPIQPEWLQVVSRPRPSHDGMVAVREHFVDTLEALVGSI